MVGWRNRSDGVDKFRDGMTHTETVCGDSLEPTSIIMAMSGLQKYIRKINIQIGRSYGTQDVD